jgi:hypothetical protein
MSLSLSLSVLAWPGRDVLHYRNLFLWRPPAAAAALGFANSLLPSPEDEAQAASEAAAKAKAAARAGGSDDEDEL